MANSMTGELAPIDWRESGWFEVRFEPGQTRSEEMEPKVGSPELEVRPELWNDNGTRFSGDNLPEVTVEDNVVVLSEPLDRAVVTVARFNDGSMPAQDAQGNPVEGEEQQGSEPRQQPPRGAGSAARGPRSSGARAAQARMNASKPDEDKPADAE